MALVLLGVALLLGQPLASAHDDTPRPATPRSASSDFDGLVEIGYGRHLYLTCRGSGSPTVLLEAGAGNNGQIWDQLALPSGSDDEAVLPAVATFTRVCTYDRPGTMLDDSHLSRSDPVPGPRTVDAMVADLHALIAAAGLPTPLVLVGHSFGGFIIRLYALTYPAEVAGLVFVDSAHEDYYQGLEALLTPEQWTMAFEPPPATDDAPPFEAIDSLSSAEQIVDAQTSGSMPVVPAVVLTHGGDFPFPDGFPVEAIERVWTSAQERLAALIPGTPLIVAGDSSHYIQLDQPDLVVAAIRDVVEAVRLAADPPGAEATPAPG